MTVYDNTRLLVDGAHSSNLDISRGVYRLTTFIAELGSQIAAWNSTRITRKELSKLTDTTLDDIGLNRADIPSLTIR